MTREEGKEFANALKNNYTIDFDKLPEFCDMAISALSGGEYIKKSELLQHVTTEELSDYKDCDVIHAEEIDELTTYSFPDSAENKGDLISRGEVESVLHNNLHALIDTDQLYQLYKDINRLPTYSIPSADIMECARAIKEYCKSKPDNVFLACFKCPFFDGLEKNEETVCKLFGKPPHEWNLPEGEKE